MTKRPAPFLLGITAVSVLVSPGAFSTGWNGGVLAAEPSSGDVARATATPAVQPAEGWYNFGIPATVIERQEIVSDRVTLLTLSNGVRLVLKPTNLVADEVLVNVSVEGGIRSLAPEPGSRAAAEIAGSMFVPAGVGLKTHEQLVAAFGPIASSLQFNIWSETFNLAGKSRSLELRSLLEILTAYVSDPGWRFDGLDAQKARDIEQVILLRSNSRLALQMQSAGLLTSRDPRRMQPSEAEIRAASPDDARRAIERPLQVGEIEIAVVGDFDLEATIAMLAGTFGTLPARPGVPASRDTLHFPPQTSTPMPLYFSGNAEDQGRMVAWPAPSGLFKSREEAVIGAMLGIIIFRLMESAAYETTDFNRGLRAYDGYLYISAHDRPESLANFSADVARIARDIVAHGVTQQEIDQAQAPAADDTRYVQANAGNQYWIITGMNLRGERHNWEKARSSLAYIGSVTPEDVQNAAAGYLIEDRSAAIVTAPEPAPQGRSQ